jgi:hypothetical protein
MNDPPAAPAPQDTPPAPPAPEGTPGPQDVDYRKRYDDLRPQFDRTAQEAAALRTEMERVTGDPDYQRQLMAQWGYEVEDLDPREPDASEELRSQLAELQEWKTNLTAEQQQAQQERQLQASLDEQFRAIDPKGEFDQPTREWLEAKSITLDPRDDGMPDIAGAFKAFTDWELSRQKQWQQTKRAPHFAADGTAAASAPDLDKMNPTELAEWMAEEAMARMNS